jgi:hypothetical protein
MKTVITIVRTIQMDKKVLAETKTKIVVRVRRVVVVAIRHPNVLGVVVPATTAFHTVGAL